MNYSQFRSFEMKIVTNTYYICHGTGIDNRKHTRSQLLHYLANEVLEPVKTCYIMHAKALLLQKQVSKSFFSLCNLSLS